MYRYEVDNVYDDEVQEPEEAEKWMVEIDELKRRWGLTIIPRLIDPGNAYQFLAGPQVPFNSGPDLFVFRGRIPLGKACVSPFSEHELRLNKLFIYNFAQVEEYGSDFPKYIKKHAREQGFSKIVGQIAPDSGRLSDLIRFYVSHGADLGLAKEQLLRIVL